MLNFKNIITLILIFILSIFFFFLNSINFFGNLTYLDLFKFITAILIFVLAISILFNFKKFFFINIKYFKSIKFIIIIIIIFFIFQFLRMNFINCENLSDEQKCICYDIHYNYYSSDFYEKKFLDSCGKFRDDLN